MSPRTAPALTLVIALALLVPASAWAQAPGATELPVREHTLANGMHFLLLPREGPPTVSFVVHVPVGSVHESLGHTGIAHFLEHLLFKGSTTVGTRDIEAERALFARMDAAHDSLLEARGRLPRPDSARAEALEARIRLLEDSARAHVVPSEFDDILSRAGARGLNATTGYEATEYFVELPANQAELWFALEADRMRNPVFREFFAERDVIAEERLSRIETNPGGLLWETFVGTAFRVHPYGVPPIGHMADIRAISRPQVEAWYERYYGPQNTIVGIVGDFDPDSAVVWAEAYFGPLEPGPPLPPVLAREPEQRGERRVEIVHDASPELLLGWKIPSAYHEDTPVLAMLANVLVGGRDTRLYRRLVRDDRTATFVTANTAVGGRHPGLFTIHAVPRAPHGTAELEEAIEEELRRLLVDPPTDDELDRVRRHLAASEVRRLTSNLGLAFQLVDSRSFWGDWRETFGYQARMQAVTADDIVGVLERWFVPERRTVGILRREEG